MFVRHALDSYRLTWNGDWVVAVGVWLDGSLVVVGVIVVDVSQRNIGGKCVFHIDLLTGISGHAPENGRHRTHRTILGFIRQNAFADIREQIVMFLLVTTPSTIAKVPQLVSTEVANESAADICGPLGAVSHVQKHYSSTFECGDTD